MNSSESAMAETVDKYGEIGDQMLGCVDLRDGTGRWLELWPLLWGRCVLQLCRPSDGLEPFHVPTEVIDQWEFDHRAYGRAAMMVWDGREGTEPRGWYRHYESGRRRPGGQEEFEYIER